MAVIEKKTEDTRPTYDLSVWRDDWGNETPEDYRKRLLIKFLEKDIAHRVAMSIAEGFCDDSHFG